MRDHLLEVPPNPMMLLLKHDQRHRVHPPAAVLPQHCPKVLTMYLCVALHIMKTHLPQDWHGKPDSSRHAELSGLVKVCV